MIIGTGTACKNKVNEVQPRPNSWIFKSAFAQKTTRRLAVVFFITLKRKVFFI
jgi:hypothetical protein